MRSDPLFSLVQKYTREEATSTALVVGASLATGATEAFLKGILETGSRPKTFCLSLAGTAFSRTRAKYASHPEVEFHEISAQPLSSDQSLSGVLRNIRSKNQITSFDVVLIDLHDLDGVIEDSELGVWFRNAKIVILNQINCAVGYDFHHQLFSDPSYDLVGHDAALRNGYAVFKRFPLSKNKEQLQPFSISFV
jgi:hypothetical protein